MANRISMSGLTLRQTADSVVLTMTPRQAHLLAASIWLGDADHSEWLDMLADLLSTSTNRPTTPPLDTAGVQNADADAEHTGAPTETPDLLAFGEAISEAAEAERSVAMLLSAAEEAAQLVQDAVAAAALKARECARQAADLRAAATSAAARTLAERVVASAQALQEAADADANRITHAATDAAALIASSVLPGAEAGAGIKAEAVAITVRDAAVMRAEQTALAAAAVARAAATAAMEAAASAADIAMALELHVADTATAVQAVATATARDVAAETAHAAEGLMTAW